MPRWEESKKERDAARERSKTPYVAPEPTVQKGVDLRRGGGVRNRGQYELPNFLQPSAISTPARGATAGRGVRPTVQTKDSKTPPTAEPPVKPRTGGGQNLPPSAAVPGTGPKGNEVGSDADPNTPGLQGPGARVNANGLVSYGKDLSSLNAFTKEFTGGYEVADISTAFQSNDLPGQYKGSNQLSYQQTPYELPEGAQPSPLDKGLAGTQGLTMQDTGYTIGEASVPNTVGRSGSAQEGSSDKPDIAEEVRTIRMNRNAGRGSRRDPP